MPTPFLEYKEIKTLFKFLGIISPSDVLGKGLTFDENEVLFDIYKKLYDTITPEDLKEILVDSFEDLE